MSVHYATVKIIETTRSTIEIQHHGDYRYVEIPEDEWREIIADWAQHYIKQVTDPNWKHA